MELCVLIMAGGHGTRFWPWSSDLLPKQFLPIAHPDKTLLQQTYERVVGLCGHERVLVLTNREYVPIVRTQLPKLDKANVIGEPMLRDTAAAVGLGTILAAHRWPEAVQIVLPADHEIAPAERFRKIIEYTASCAFEDSMLYTIGIKPSFPSPAYGYLARSEMLDSPAAFLRSTVSAFVEKPDIRTARRYVGSGNYYWNAGMFIWRPDVVEAAIARHLPEHARLLPAAVETEAGDDFDACLEEIFTRLPKISIDFGIMQAEGAEGRVRTVQGDFSWSDMGGWQAFSEKIEPDQHDNRVFGHGYDWNGLAWVESFHPRRPQEGDKDEDLSLGEVFTMDARNNLVFNNRRGHRIAMIGVDDLVLVHTHRATLVTTRSHVDQIKALVSALPDDQRTGGPVKPKKVHKPWGWELWWGWSDDFAGKTLFLKQGKRFSLQYHVVKEEVIYLHEGLAKVQTAPRGGVLTEIVMEPGDAIHVEPGRLHRIEALEDCLLFESSTPFLWDVVRLADDFGREATREAEVGQTVPVKQ